jgi:hypothetical protein
MNLTGLGSSLCRFAAPVIVVTGFGYLGAWAGDGDDLAAVNEKIASQPFPGVPSGTYSSWTEDQRKAAQQKVLLTCGLVCGDFYSNPKRADVEKQRGLAESRLCGWECALGHLPPDHPMVAELKKRIQDDYDEAHRLGSQLPPPQLPK